MNHIAPIEPWGFMRFCKERGDTVRVFLEVWVTRWSHEVPVAAQGEPSALPPAGGSAERGPLRSLALPAAAARGSRHRARMGWGRDGAAGRGRGGAAPDGVAAARKLPRLPPILPGDPAEQGRRERGCGAGPTLVISHRKSPLACFSPGSLCHLLSGHSCRPPGRWPRHGGPSELPRPGRRSLLPCCSPSCSAAGLPAPSLPG